jgi:hypothetical protein
VGSSLWCPIRNPSSCELGPGLWTCRYTASDVDLRRQRNSCVTHLKPGTVSGFDPHGRACRPQHLSWVSLYPSSPRFPSKLERAAAADAARHDCWPRRCSGRSAPMLWRSQQPLSSQVQHLKHLRYRSTGHSARERSHGQHHAGDLKCCRRRKRASGTSPIRVWRTVGHHLHARHMHYHSCTRA